MNLLTALQQFASTNWAERAAAIARFVDQNNPDVVALNEMSKVIVEGFGTPLDTHTDFLPILRRALDKRGLHYVVAGKVANLHPVINLGGPVIDWQDYDVVLTRRGIGISNVVTGNYAARVPGVSLGGFATFDLIRGYVIVDITDGTRTARFAASHVEDQALELNLAQSAELMGMLATSPEPVVIASDLNTDPADPAPTSYRNFLAAGYQDAWLARAGQPHASGFTCCHSDGYLRAITPGLSKRIDLVLVRPEGRVRRSGIRPVDITIVGDQLSERTASGLWPSDHAGVIARLEWQRVDGK